MQTSLQGIEFIKSFETFFSRAYDDATEKVVQIGGSVRGTLTIGYGHTSSAGLPVVHIGDVISEAQAEVILANDLRAVESEVARYITRPLIQQQNDALVSFQFNTGWLGHPHCSLAAAVNAGKDTLAATDFMLYDQASGRVLAGLVRRRHAEAQMYSQGIYLT